MSGNQPDMHLKLKKKFLQENQPEFWLVKLPQKRFYIFFGGAYLSENFRQAHITNQYQVLQPTIIKYHLEYLRVRIYLYLNL